MGLSGEGLRIGSWIAGGVRRASFHAIYKVYDALIFRRRSIDFTMPLRIGIARRSPPALAAGRRRRSGSVPVLIYTK